MGFMVILRFIARSYHHRQPGQCKVTAGRRAGEQQRHPHAKPQSR